MIAEKQPGVTKRRLKIGKTKNPEKRRKQLQTGNASEIRIEGVIKCSSPGQAAEVEKAAHEHFKKHHIRGEWFKLTDFVLCQVWDFCQVYK